VTAAQPPFSLAAVGQAVEGDGSFRKQGGAPREAIALPAGAYEQQTLALFVLGAASTVPSGIPKTGRAA
jgi:hypothetical protein